MSQQIQLKINLRPHQLEIWRNLKRFNVLVCHRRFGKTFMVLAKLVADALSDTRPLPRYAYIAPTYKQAKRIAFSYLIAFTYTIPGAVVNRSELSVTFSNGAVIQLLGAEDYDSLRGIYLMGLVIDETAQIPTDAWGEVLRPTLSDYKGWCIFIGTPKGRMNLFYDQFERASARDNYYAAIFKASETGIIDEEEMDDIKAELSKAQYEQEMECSFDAAIMGAYYADEIAQAQKDARITSVMHDKTLPVYAGVDLGYGDLSVYIMFQKAGTEVRIIDVVAFKQSPIPDHVQELRKLEHCPTMLLLPHDAQQHELTTGRTRKQVYDQLGMSNVVVPRHSIHDGIEMSRNTLANTWIDQDRCKILVEALLMYRTEYDDVKRVFKTQPLHDWSSHYADAFRMIAAGRGMVGGWGKLNYGDMNHAVI